MNAKNKDYIAILLEENIEGLMIEGMEHLSDEALQGMESMHSKEESELREKIKSASDAKD